MKEGLAGEGQPIAVNAAALDADDTIARLQVAAGDDPVERHGADRGARQVETAHDVFELCGFAARYRDAGLLGTDGKPDPDRLEDLRIDVLDGDVIDERQRSGADADQVVDIHRDAVDADRVVAIHRMRDDRLRSDPVGAQGEPRSADVDHIGEVTDRQLHGAEIALPRPAAGDALDEPAEAALGFVGIDPAPR